MVPSSPSEEGTAPPLIMTELHVLHDLVVSYQQSACLVRVTALGVMWDGKMVVVAWRGRQHLSDSRLRVEAVNEVACCFEMTKCIAAIIRACLGTSAALSGTGIRSASSSSNSVSLKKAVRVKTDSSVMSRTVSKTELTPLAHSPNQRRGAAWAIKIMVIDKSRRAIIPITPPCRTTSWVIHEKMRFLNKLIALPLSVLCLLKDVSFPRSSLGFGGRPRFNVYHFLKTCLASLSCFL
jgi:hypothetical protein